MRLLMIITGSALSVLFLQSCTKDQTNNLGISDAESRIKKIVFDSAFISIGFTTLNYADDKLVNIHMFDSIHNSSLDFDISYPAQNQIKVVNRSNSNRLNLFSYSNNDQLVKIEKSYYFSGQWSKYSYTLHSSNNKLDSVTASDPAKTLWKYKYDANGNIVQFVRPENLNWQIDTINFKYDNLPTLYQKNQLYFLIYHSMISDGLEERCIPSLFSKNNLISSEWRNNNKTIVNYVTDNKGRLTKLFYDQYDEYATKYYY